jgi:hypothetical protein
MRVAACQPAVGLADSCSPVIAIGSLRMHDACWRNCRRLSRVSALSKPEEQEMENFDLKGRDFPPARLNAAPEVREELALEKLSEWADNSDIRKTRDDVARRAKEYSDANESDLEED